MPASLNRNESGVNVNSSDTVLTGKNKKNHKGNDAATVQKVINAPKASDRAKSSDDLRRNTSETFEI
jgi:hypothetical protein